MGRSNTEVETTHMNITWTAIPRCVAAAILLLPLSTHPQQKQTTPDAQTKPSPKPGPEMDQLKFLRGYWHYVTTYEKTSFYPNGGAGHGTYTVTEGPGGFSQIAEFQGTSPDGREVGHEVTTWDADEHAYKSYLFANIFPGCMVRTGHWEGSTLVFEADMRYQDSKLHLESAITPNPDGSFTTLEKFSTDGGPLQTSLTMKATREKVQ
jgi:hypothetical protein